MMINLAAYTPPGTNPPYVSINYHRDDKEYSITVRSESGAHAQIRLDEHNLYDLLAHAMVNLELNVEHMKE